MWGTFGLAGSYAASDEMKQRASMEREKEGKHSLMHKLCMNYVQLEKDSRKVCAMQIFI